MMTWAGRSRGLIRVPTVSLAWLCGPDHILFEVTSHDRRGCWSVGSLPYLPCHLLVATCQCASASIVGSLPSSSDHWHSGWHSWWNPTAHPMNPSGLVALVSESKLQGAYDAARCQRAVCGFTEEVPMFLESGAGGSDIPDTIAARACSHWRVDLSPLDDCTSRGIG